MFVSGTSMEEDPNTSIEPIHTPFALRSRSTVTPISCSGIWMLPCQWPAGWEAVWARLTVSSIANSAPGSMNVIAIFLIFITALLLSTLLTCDSWFADPAHQGKHVPIPTYLRMGCSNSSRMSATFRFMNREAWRERLARVRNGFIRLRHSAMLLRMATRTLGDVGGTPGGLGEFAVGFVMACVGGYLFVNQGSVAGLYWALLGS